MQEPNQAPRAIYFVLLIVLIILAFTWGYRMVDGMQTAGATATARMQTMLENQTEFYATATASRE